MTLYTAELSLTKSSVVVTEVIRRSVLHFFCTLHQYSAALFHDVVLSHLKRESSQVSNPPATLPIQLFDNTLFQPLISRRVHD